MQNDPLPNQPTSGEYLTVMTAIGVFSSHLIAHPLVDTTAGNKAKLIIDMITKHISANNSHQRQRVSFHINQYSRNNTNFGKNI